MPTYEYICDKCEHQFEEKQSFSSDPLLECPTCHENALRRIFYAPHVAVRKDPATLAHLAARNTQKMGHYEYESKVEQKHKKEKPWWRDNDKIDFSLTNMNAEQKKTYIETGRKI